MPPRRSARLTILTLLSGGSLACAASTPPSVSSTVDEDLAAHATPADTKASQGIADADGDPVNCHVYFSKVCTVKEYENHAGERTNKYTGLSPIFVFPKACPGEGDLQLVLVPDGEATYNAWGVDALQESPWARQLMVEYRNFVHEQLPPPCLNATDGDHSTWAGFYNERATVENFATQLREGWERGGWQGGCLGFEASGASMSLPSAVCPEGHAIK